VDRKPIEYYSDGGGDAAAVGLTPEASEGRPPWSNWFKPRPAGLFLRDVFNLSFRILSSVNNSGTPYQCLTNVLRHYINGCNWSTEL